MSWLEPPDDFYTHELLSTVEGNLRSINLRVRRTYSAHTLTHTHTHTHEHIHTYTHTYARTTFPGTQWALELGQSRNRNLHRYNPSLKRNLHPGGDPEVNGAFYKMVFEVTIIVLAELYFPKKNSKPGLVREIQGKKRRVWGCFQFFIPLPTY